MKISISIFERIVIMDIPNFNLLRPHSACHSNTELSVTKDQKQFKLVYNRVCYVNTCWLRLSSLEISSFSAINTSPRPAQNIRTKMAVAAQATAKNRRLAQQMANRPTVQAALKIKQVWHYPVPI